MTLSDSAGGFNLFLQRDVISKEFCKQLIVEFSTTTEFEAPVYGQGQSAVVNERTRKVARVNADAATVTKITSRILELRAAISSHFDIQLADCEEPQFLRYRPGDFFVAHQDGNTGLIRSELEQWRKISVIMFLNDQSEAPAAGTFAGGSLVFHDWRQQKEFVLTAEAGLLVAFRAETTHEVKPVTSGERYSIVSWYGCTTVPPGRCSSRNY
jgi:SM-20-related protein